MKILESTVYDATESLFSLEVKLFLPVTQDKYFSILTKKQSIQKLITTTNYP